MKPLSIISLLVGVVGLTLCIYVYSLHINDPYSNISEIKSDVYSDYIETAKYHKQTQFLIKFLGVFFLFNIALSIVGMVKAFSKNKI